MLKVLVDGFQGVVIPAPKVAQHAAAVVRGFAEIKPNEVHDAVTSRRCPGGGARGLQVEQGLRPLVAQPPALAASRSG